MNKIQPSIFWGVFGGIFCIIGMAMLLQTSVRLTKIPQVTNQKTKCSNNFQIPLKVRNWCNWIEKYAKAVRLDPMIIAAIIQVESEGNPSAVSKSGAVGLMQVMPRDGKAQGYICNDSPCFDNRPLTNELMDPEFNIYYGTKILSDFLERSGNLREALHFYGPSQIGYTYADSVLERIEGYK